LSGDEIDVGMGWLSAEKQAPHRVETGIRDDVWTGAGVVTAAVSPG